MNIREALTQMPGTEVVRNLHRNVLIACLEQTRGNQLKAAKLYGCHRNTFYRQMANLAIPSKVTKRRKKPAGSVRPSDAFAREIRKAS